MMEHDKGQTDPDIQIVDIPDADADSAGSAGKSNSPSFSWPNFSPPSTRRKRQLILTAVLVVLALLIIIVSTSGIRNVVIGIVRQAMPTPTPTLAPGDDLFYVQADPPWGHFLIDGHLIAHLPVALSNPPLHFPVGHHVLQWQAAPFITQRCILSVPADFGIDTCIDNDAVPLKNGLSAYVISFTVSLNTLSAQKRTALINKAQSTLNSQQSSAMVRSGEHYASSAPCSQTLPTPSQFADCIATAKQPLKATLNFQLDTNANSSRPCATPEPQPVCSFSLQSCHLFCPIGNFGNSSSTWGVGAVVNALWTFTTLNGKVVERNVPDDSSEEDVVPLLITWDSTGWQVTAQLSNSSAPGFGYPVCQPVQYNINLLGNGGALLNNTQAYFQWSYFSDSTLTDGCLGIAQVDNGFTTTPTPTTSSAHTAYCLFRFGVILSANPLAQQYFPYLPVADAYEQNLAKQMVAATGFSSGSSSR